MALEQVLNELYHEMLPLSSKLINVSRIIGGFGALFYIGARVWKHIAHAEPVDVYPLLRPFALGLAISFFPVVISVMNTVMQPTVAATAAMVKDSDQAVAVLLKQKEEAIKQTANWQMYVGEDGNGDRDKWYKYTHPNDPNEGVFEGVGNDVKFAMAKASYNFRNSIKEWLSEVLQLLYQAAGLCINSIRTFYMIVLAILGPLVFAIAIYDGFAHTLPVWIGRYINVFLWLPVANLFGAIISKIQEKMLQLDINQVNTTGDSFFSQTDTAYLIFLLIGIVGYCTVPGVANYIVHAGGGNALVMKVTSMFSAGSRSATTKFYGMTGMAADRMEDGATKMIRSMSGHARDNYMKEKLNGNAE